MKSDCACHKWNGEILCCETNHHLSVSLHHPELFNKLFMKSYYYAWHTSIPNIIKYHYSPCFSCSVSASLWFITLNRMLKFKDSNFRLVLSNAKWRRNMNLAIQKMLYTTVQLLSPYRQHITFEQMTRSAINIMAKWSVKMSIIKDLVTLLA